MTIIDFGFIVLVGFGALTGFTNGLLKQVATIFGLIAGLFVAKALYLSLAEKICPSLTDSMTAAQVIAFVAIWILVPVVCTLVAWMLSRLLDVMALGWINNLLGLGVGILIAVLLLSICLNVLDFLDSDNTILSETIKRDSMLYYPIKDIIGRFFPTIQEAIQPFKLT